MSQLICRYAMYPLLLLGLAAGCGSSRINGYVASTDNIVRSRSQPVALLEQPSSKTRVIGEVVAFESATRLAMGGRNQPDEELWGKLLEIAGRMGADAVLFQSRRVESCSGPVVQTTTEVGGAQAAETTQALGALCVVITAQALLVEGAEHAFWRPGLDCRELQKCRTHRDDALRFE